MQEFLRYRDGVIKISVILSAAFFLLFMQGGRTDIALGLALGAGWSVAKLWLRAAGLQKTARRQDTSKNIRYTLAGSFALYIATGVVLATAFAVREINQWATLAGLLVTNAVMIVREALHAAAPGHIR